MPHLAVVGALSTRGLQLIMRRAFGHASLIVTMCKRSRAVCCVARNDCIYTFSMDGVEGAGPLPRDVGARGGRARPDQSYLDAGAPAQAMLPCLALNVTMWDGVNSMFRDQSMWTLRAYNQGLRRRGDYAQECRYVKDLRTIFCLGSVEP